MLHGKTRKDHGSGETPATFASLVEYDDDDGRRSQRVEIGQEEEDDEDPRASEDAQSWRRNVRLLLLCFSVSGLFTLATYFLPVLRNIPLFGPAAATTWLWTLNPSLAYVGQGIIMGPATTLHMLLGAVVGWAFLSPLAKYKGWAPGPVDDWEDGSKGWIVWTSLAIMLADSIVSLGYLSCRQAVGYFPLIKRLVGRARPAAAAALFARGGGYASIDGREDDDAGGGRGGGGGGGGPAGRTTGVRSRSMSNYSDASSDSDVDDEDEKEEEQQDAPAEQQISDRTVAVGLVLSIVFCIGCIHAVFGDLVPLYATVTAVLMALVLSIMGVRALGETDLNPVSGISKLAQLFFALIIPQSNKSSVLINLVAGAVVCLFRLCLLIIL